MKSARLEHKIQEKIMLISVEILNFIVGVLKIPKTELVTDFLGFQNS